MTWGSTSGQDGSFDGRWPSTGPIISPCIIRRSWRLWSESPQAADQKAEGQKESKGNKSKDPDIISYTSGNETIIMPTGYKENTGVNVVLNIFIGLVVGVALMWFLAVPAKVKSVRNQTAAQIREYSDQITAKQTEINNLQSQLDELNGTGADSSESAAEAPGGSYEMLIDAYTSFQAGDADTCRPRPWDSVKADELSDNAKAIYNQMYGTLHATM